MMKRNFSSLKTDWSRNLHLTRGRNNVDMFYVRWLACCCSCCDSPWFSSLELLDSKSPHRDTTSSCPARNPAAEFALFPCGFISLCGSNPSWPPMRPIHDERNSSYRNRGISREMHLLWMFYGMSWLGKVSQHFF